MRTISIKRSNENFYALECNTLNRRDKTYDISAKMLIEQSGLSSELVRS